MLLLTLKTLQFVFIHVLNREFFCTNWWKSLLPGVIRVSSTRNARTILDGTFKVFYCVINTNASSCMLGIYGRTRRIKHSRAFLLLPVLFHIRSYLLSPSKLIVNVYLQPKTRPTAVFPSRYASLPSSNTPRILEHEQQPGGNIYIGRNFIGIGIGIFISAQFIWPTYDNRSHFTGINDVHNAVLKSGARMPGKFSSIINLFSPFSLGVDAIFLPLLSKLH